MRKFWLFLSLPLSICFGLLAYNAHQHRVSIATAFAQQACQWNYSFTGGQAVATYCSIVNAPTLANAVPNTTSLATYSKTSFPYGVWRNDFSTGYGAPPQFYQSETGTCAANSRTNNSGGCINLADGNSVYAIFGPTVNILEYGPDLSGTNAADTVIQSAIDDLPVNGGHIALPCGTYKFSTGLTLGNGNSSAVSTRNGIYLDGTGGAGGQEQDYNIQACTHFLGTAASGTMIQTHGPMQHWGLRDIAVDCNSVENIGLQNISGQKGDSRNLSFWNCLQVGIYETAVSAIPPGVDHADASHNRWVNTSILVPNGTVNATGVVLAGNSTVGVDYGIYDNLYINLPSTGTTGIFGIKLQITDSYIFRDVHVVGGTTSATVLLLDYSANAAFPANTHFHDIDLSGSNAPPVRVANQGSPSGGIPNFVDNYSIANGANVPNVANFCVQTATILQLCSQDFSQLPASPPTGTTAYLSDGLAANCGDTTCTTWGTNVTGGGGALKLYVWYNGSHWTLTGK